MWVLAVSKLVTQEALSVGASLHFSRSRWLSPQAILKPEREFCCLADLRTQSSVRCCDAQAWGWGGVELPLNMTDVSQRSAHWPMDQIWLISFLINTLTGVQSFVYKFLLQSLDQWLEQGQRPAKPKLSTSGMGAVAQSKCDCLHTIFALHLFNLFDSLKRLN